MQGMLDKFSTTELHSVQALCIKMEFYVSSSEDLVNLEEDVFQNFDFMAQRSLKWLHFSRQALIISIQRTYFFFIFCAHMCDTACVSWSAHACYVQGSTMAVYLSHFFIFSFLIESSYWECEFYQFSKTGCPSSPENLLSPSPWYWECGFHLLAISFSGSGDLKTGPQFGVARELRERLLLPGPEMYILKFTH